MLDFFDLTETPELGIFHFQEPRGVIPFSSVVRSYHFRSPRPFQLRETAGRSREKSPALGDFRKNFSYKPPHYAEEFFRPLTETTAYVTIKARRRSGNDRTPLGAKTDKGGTLFLILPQKKNARQYSDRFPSGIAGKPPLCG